jgi:non-homologous end joining protein Ku
MARNITINYGLLSVAAKYEPANLRAESMVNLCVGQPGHPQHDASPLTMPKHCTACGPIVDFDVIVKGIKTGEGYAVVTQQEVADAKKLNVEQFKGKIDIVPFTSTEFLTATGQGASLQYVTPVKGSEDHYQLLLKLISEHPELTFAGQYTPVSKAGLYRLTVRTAATGEACLVMEERTREQSMKPVPETSGDVNDALFGLLEATLDKMEQPYDPALFEDTYAVAVAQMALDASDMVNVKAGTVEKSAVVKVSDADLAAKLKALAEA